MYYALLIFATVLYALSFYFNRNVERQCEEGIDTAILFSTVVWAETLVLLLIAMGGKLQFTPFSFACAAIHALFLISFAFLNLKAFAVADLAKYSMFTMLGGMIVPFAFGIILFNEELTPGKVICCILVAVALYIQLRRKGQQKGAFLFNSRIFC